MKQNIDSLRIVLLCIFILILTSCGGSEGDSSNTTPVANAGQNQIYITGSTVKLSAAASTVSKASSLSYAWTILNVPTGSTATLSNSTVAEPTFKVDIDGG